MSRRVCLYSPADLNLVSGSSIWVESVAATLVAGQDIEVVLPLRAPERRRIITDQIRRLPRVELVDPRRQRRWVPPTGLYANEALDLVEKLDAERSFDAIILRSFASCLLAVRRAALRDRLWSTYIYEPERDIEDPSYVAGLTEIAQNTRYAVVQSEEQRALLEAAVPAARGKTIILPPAVPPASSGGDEVLRVAPVGRRLFYAGKFHPFYSVLRMVDFLEELRGETPDLELHVIGDQIFRLPNDSGWAGELEERLTSTEGVVWHGAVARDDVGQLLGEGGIALSLWDYRHGSTMNDLAVSTKLLDYCVAGVPVILNRTAAQERILGADYPLFVRSPDEALPLIRRLLADPDLYLGAANRCRAAAETFSYPRVFEGIAPYLEERRDARLHLAQRPKLAGSEARIGLPLPSHAPAIPQQAIDAFRMALAVTPDAVLCAGVAAAPGAPPVEPGNDPAAALRASLPEDVSGAVALRTVDDPWNWWRTLGLALAPEGVAIDEASLELGEASGAIVVRSGEALAEALGIGP